MPSTSFGDIDIAGRAALAGRIIVKPRLVSVHRNFLRGASKWISYHWTKQRGDTVAPPAKNNSTQDSGSQNAKRKEANYAVVLTDRMPEPLPFANC